MHLFVILSVLLLTTSLSASTSKPLTVPLKISSYTLLAEIANTQLSRAKGLMYRESLDENSGMLFVFPKVGYYGMWMLNTYIPLSVAFVSENGIILNIVDMIPQTQIAHNSAGMAKYALEMNLDWFAARKIKAGMQIIGVEQISAEN
ncbi:hypothetical protein SAMN05216419_100633 [Nitrosomonas cryotolerans]|uniref:DUF192 domain-containing protein n=1 Tax=Nitrosomonas cryotolerans ATCC 49181 TaxID=1131553 RepID=A0A1N6J0E7_9PROT|nr:DUF192 domain-containing protein [Nitrosomonas cryotolerans]SFP54087.1 hypothetical protein SAMN05216419_100633 [Nitrosomonas cryotolerans]SIO37790.1 hypothetical protein SAMN02743940_2220 [Nitrosomonas cryotolerans ATCC 49181]